MKKRILSGAQPSGQLHIGNYFGMIDRMVSSQSNADLFCFVANYHSLHQ
jgi:tryptophanyl-tRNA synthetase